MANFKSELLKWSRRKDIRQGGLHNEIFAAAAFLLEEGRSEESVFKLLRAAANTVQDRVVPDREIHSGIRYAKRKIEGGEKTQRWPVLAPEYRAEIASHYQAEGIELTKGETSIDQSAARLLEILYRPSDLVCLGYSAFEFVTRLRNDACEILKNGVRVEYVNPSPMSAFVGLNKDGAMSDHTEANTGAKIYQVIEFDSGSIHEHAAILCHLAKKIPLAMLVFSGGKSLHGWFYAPKAPTEFMSEFFADACSLGADPVMWGKSQFSRLPGGRNAKTGKAQSVLYLNPEFTLNG